MHTISQSSAPNGLQQLFATSGQAQGAQPPPANASSSTVLESLQGTDGQSLIDIRDQLEAAVEEVLEAQEGDFRTDVRDAIRTTLEANGFDVNAVGSIARLEAYGATDAAQSAVVLAVTALPQDSFGFAGVSASPGSAASTGQSTVEATNSIALTF